MLRIPILFQPFSSIGTSKERSYVRQDHAPMMQ